MHSYLLEWMHSYLLTFCPNLYLSNLPIWGHVLDKLQLCRVPSNHLSQYTFGLPLPLLNPSNSHSLTPSPLEHPCISSSHVQSASCLPLKSLLPCLEYPIFFFIKTPNVSYKSIRKVLATSHYSLSNITFLFFISFWWS